MPLRLLPSCVLCRSRKQRLLFSTSLGKQAAPGVIKSRACPASAFLTSDYSVGYAHDTQLQLGVVRAQFPEPFQRFYGRALKPVETGKEFGPPIPNTSLK